MDRTESLSPTCQSAPITTLTLPKMENNSISSTKQSFGPNQTTWTGQNPYIQPLDGQNPYIQLAVFEVPQLCQYLELEGHLWTGN